MKYFTIENEHNIALHASAQEAEVAENAERFRNEAQLAKVAADWPMSRLVEIYNSPPGVNAVTKFKNRATAVTRICKAIQSLGQPAPTAAEDPGPVSETPPVSVVPEPTPVAELESSGMAQPETVNSTEAAVSTTVAHRRPTWRRWSPTRRRRPPAQRRRPSPRPIKMPVSFVRGARPARFSQC